MIENYKSVHSRLFQGALAEKRLMCIITVCVECREYTERGSIENSKHVQI
jgi:hypothetical protein